MTDRAQRLEGLRAALGPTGVDAAVLTGAENRRYLSGFTGSDGVLWVSRNDAALIVDFRYWEQAEAEAPGWRLVRQEPTRGVAEILADLCRDAGVTRLGCEAAHLTVESFRAWQGALAVELVPMPPLTEGLRAVKDEDEVAAIARTAALADRALRALLPAIRPGVREYELALELEIGMRRLGAEDVSFPTIVASGPRGSLPHAQPTDRRLAAGEMVTLDYGAQLGGYCSDCTRTYAVGEPGVKAREIHALVARAVEAGLAAVRPGARCVDVDAAARNVIAQAGYGDRFGHGLGHGVGLEVHEGPRLSTRAGDATLVEGMVVTVEPGVYIPGWGGVRIEELVVVRADGPQLLTGVPRELLVL